ncbi:MAG TPA: LPXTG cell wall anchor domain-containing protein [Solirubrobacteraceae bacterium]|nr:LPXTG cell wall anchor domain-containing protein [Solirubrobacteraceae bacterium]
MTRNKIGAFALVIGSLVIFALPAGSFGSSSAEMKAAREALVKAGQQLQAGLESTVQKTGDATAGLVNKTKARVQKATDARSRATATDPPTQPPLHGANPHGQGTVGVVDVDPSAERPLAADPDGGDSGEDIVVGRARGERNADGTYHGHISALGLFGNDVIPVDTAQGETKTGPAEALQREVLDPICAGTQVCLGVLTMDSTTNANGSTNDFAVARASLLGLGVGAAESNGTIVTDANCQTAIGTARTANVTTSTGSIAAAANSSSTSRSCRGQAPVVTNTSEVIGLGGTGVPLPAAGCANGTPDTQAGLPGLLPIICNAEELVGNNAGVREALDVFALQVGTNSLLKETTAAAESLSVAPEAGTQCTDGIDNDGDGVADTNDPGCHTDNNAANPASFDPTDNDETDRRAPTGGSGGDDDGGDAAQCSDGRDNDGDGVIDEDDPGCHEGNNINNPYNPDDDSEGSDGGGGGGAGAGSGALDDAALPFTGTDVIGIALAGLLVLAGGLLLRRREDGRTVA